MTISDIELETRALCDADTTSYPAATLLRRENAAYEEIVGKIIGLDGTWQFDDSNYSTFPIGTTTLVVGQHDYAFDTTFLNIEKVAYLDNDGINYRFLQPIDKMNVSEPLETIFPNNGRPICYDKQGQSVLIYPAPSASDVTLAAGLKAYFQRTASIFLETTPGTPDDTDKVPGFASPFHMLICYKSAIPFCMSYKKDRVALYEKKAMDLEHDLMKFYGKREKDVRKVITMGGIQFH